MLHINSKSDCTGCTACVSGCPVDCIHMESDEQGFIYPVFDSGRCIECGLCERVCPVINKNPKTEPQQVYACTNQNQYVLDNSSSGGVFHSIASWVIANGGIVYGASFTDNWSVRHIGIHSSAEISRLMGSKYVQSDNNLVFRDIKSHLNNGRLVLYSGCPCQISGLRHYLRKNYDNLISVDFVCHGVPSPKIWKEYLLKTINRHSTEEESLHVSSVSFRDKTYGWRDFSLRIDMQNGEKKYSFIECYKINPYMKGFIQNLFLRPSCFKCPTKSGRSGSDITLGDFWGVQKELPELYNEKGVSLVMANTTKGLSILQNVEKMPMTAIDIKHAIKGNSAIEHSAIAPKCYDSFWENYSRNGLSVLDCYLKKLDYEKKLDNLKNRVITFPGIKFLSSLKKFLLK